MKLTPKTILLSLCWLAASCASNPAYAASDLTTTLPVKDRAPVGMDAPLKGLALTYQNPRTFPVAFDLAYEFKSKEFVPCIHNTTWHTSLGGKLVGELWAPVIAVQSKVGLGGAVVVGYESSGWGFYAGTLGKLVEGELPSGALVLGIRGTIRF